MKKFLIYLVFLIIVFAVQALSATLTDTTIDSWYHKLLLPSWIVSDNIFNIVWIILYVLIGIAGARIWFNRKSFFGKKALVFWIVQLIINTFWSFLFFSLQRPLLGAIAISLIVFFSAVMIVCSFQFDIIAAWILVPYLIWILYACVLNWSIVYLN